MIFPGFAGDRETVIFEVAQASPCTTLAERILTIDDRQNSPRDEIPLLTDPHRYYRLKVEDVLISRERTNGKVEVVLEGHTDQNRVLCLLD